MLYPIRVLHQFDQISDVDHRLVIHHVQKHIVVRKKVDAQKIAPSTRSVLHHEYASLLQGMIYNVAISMAELHVLKDLDVIMMESMVYQSVLLFHH